MTRVGALRRPPAPALAPRSAAGPLRLGRLAARLPRRRPWRGGRATLPARIDRAIALEQQQGEILIGWVQMAAVVTFGTLYALAPKTFQEDAPFVPVPWALGAYFGFTLVRLWLSYRRPLPGWMLAASVVVDMGLLLGLIWSFHLQYRQPPAFYLKAPTLLYVFIFIALRTLRFDLRYLLLSGAAAVVGWLALLAYAIAFDPGGAPITRDYVAYMTSARVLLGGEVDKILSIIVVTAILAVALRRARRMLELAVVEGAAARDLRRFFAPEIAQQITRAEQSIRPGQGELRQAAVMFVDLRGFTPLAMSLKPCEVVGLLADYQAHMVPAIQRHGGSIDKFLGDGILASFGAAAPSAAYAADALRAADTLFDAAQAWAEERAQAGLPTPSVGIGIAVGPVVFGAVGDESRLEYTVIGDTVNLAAKLEKQNKTEGTRGLATAAAHRLACAQGYASSTMAPKNERRAVRVGGVEAPLDLVVLA